MDTIVFKRLFSLHKVKCDEGLRHPSLRARSCSKSSRFNPFLCKALDRRPWSWQTTSPHQLWHWKKRLALWLLLWYTSIFQYSIHFFPLRTKIIYTQEAVIMMDINTWTKWKSLLTTLWFILSFSTISSTQISTANAQNNHSPLLVPHKPPLMLK